MPADWSDSILFQCFVVSNNGLYAISAGYMDCSIKVHSLRHSGEVINCVSAIENGHNDVVTCLQLSETQDILISGAKDGSIVFWSALCRLPRPGRHPLIGKPHRLLTIHFDAVRTIAINTKVGVIVTAADDATIAVYSIARKQFIRQLFLEGSQNHGKHAFDELPQTIEIVTITISDTGFFFLFFFFFFFAVFFVSK